MREMKDSGIEWIGEIPAQWDKKKIKNAVSLIGSGTTPTSGNYLYYENGDVYWIQSGDIYGKSVITNTSAKITEYAIHSVSALRMYNPPYIVVAMYGGSVGNIAISKIHACVNQACCCIKQDSNNDLKYLYYWLVSCREDFLRTSEGGGQPNISQAKIKNQYYVQPPLSEQKRIADFLDGKCAEIDTLVADIQSQIDTLEQYKRSVITETVTKGLNPDAQMKDSGVPWIGTIPAHWRTDNPKYHFAQRKDRATQGMVQLTASQKYGVITQTEYMERTGASIVTVQKDFDILKLVCSGDFVIHMRSFQGGLEYSEKTGSISSAYVMLIPQETIREPRYYKWFFKSSNYIDALKSTSNLVRDGQAMRWANFIQLPITLPPERDQVAIADFLDTKVAEVDSIIDQKKEQLTVLENYKKSLIYEYVTGKKEVPAQ